MDDHRLFRMELKAAFMYGYSDLYVTGEAANGDELFGMLDDTPADLVLLDINMPGIGGTGAEHRAKQYNSEI